MITSLDQLDLNKQYSYADYLTWQFAERIELLKGYIRQMAAPNLYHQRISRRLTARMENLFQKSPCEVFTAPFDVRLYNRKKSELQAKEVFTVVQPDLCVVCDKSKLDTRGCNGSPDFIIEILSPNNSKVDLVDKYALYQLNGVTEYWIVFPQEKIVQQFVLTNEKYELHAVYDDKDIATSFLFPELQVNLVDVFEEI
jgi:Uma2 family endonuclease